MRAIDPIAALVVAAIAATESLRLWHGKGDDCCAPIGFGDPSLAGRCETDCACR